MTAPLLPPRAPNSHAPGVTDIVIVGGHTKLALRLTQHLLARGDTRVLSTFANGWHARTVAAAGAAPFVLSPDDDPPETFAAVFSGKHLVYLCAGAHGARKVCDALELVPAPRPRLVFLSAPVPEDEGMYLDVERDIATRTAFPWTILRAAVGDAEDPTISCDDVAYALATLTDRPDAAGIIVDLHDGEERIEEKVDRLIRFQKNFLL